MSVAQAHQRYKNRRKQADADAPAEAAETPASAEPALFSQAWFDASIQSNEQVAQQLVARSQQLQAQLAQVEAQFQQTQGVLATLRQQRELVAEKE